MLFGERVHDAFYNRWEEVSASTLAEQGTNFLVIEEGDDFDLAGPGVFGRGGGSAVDECLNSGPGAKLVVNAAGEDELLLQATDCSRLVVIEFEFPVYNA